MRHTIKEAFSHVRWPWVAAYYIAACALAWPLFWLRDRTSLWPKDPRASNVLTTIIMWAPGLAALAVHRIQRPANARPVTFTGSWRLGSWAFYLLPPTFLLLFQAHAGGLTPWQLSLYLIAMGLLRILGEEIGWRGYLQTALRPLPWMLRHIIIGTLWECWHFTTRLGDPEPWILIWAVNVLLSMAMGYATERTRSLLVAVTLHAWFNAAFELPMWQTYAALGIFTPIAALLMWRWPRPQSMSIAS